MSTGVYAWDAARFLVDDPRARRAFHFFRRAGHGQVEHYWSSTLASWYSPRRLLDRDPALMSWHRGVYVGARHGVSNSFLTASELDFVKAGMWMAHLFVRKVSLEHNGTVGLLDAIDAGAAAGLPTAADAAAAARAPAEGSPRRRPPTRRSTRGSSPSCRGRWSTTRRTRSAGSGRR